MENFTAYNPTRLHFGKGAVSGLGDAALKLGEHALLVYGGGSVLRNGSYRDVLGQLKSKGVRVTEFNGIKANPRAKDVDLAARLGLDEGVDHVVAVGGGSVIDSSKIIAICISTGAPAWDVMKGRLKNVTALPLIAVLTLAATGTEMNCVSVLQNEETMEKIGFRDESIYPADSFLDPEYTTSVPASYTAYGIVDLVAHCLEAWFGKGDASLSDRFVISIIREAMQYGPRLMNSLGDYDLRARIMWSATNALNNITLYGRTSGDWGVHALGHTLSFLFDTPHGATLSIIYPAWMNTLRKRAGARIVQLGQELFNKTGVDETIRELSTFFSELGSPVTCKEAGIDPSRKEEILHLMNLNRDTGIHYVLSDGDREEIMTYVW
jgi:alcohol dehydrogenase YqhD (iron-dependent ADH family)